MPLPNYYLSGSVANVVKKTLASTVANRKLSVAQDLREHRVLVGGPHKRSGLEPDIGVTDERQVLGVKHVHAARATSGASRNVIIEDNRGALEHKVLEARVRHIGVGVTDVAGEQRLVRLVAELARHDDRRLIVTHRNGVVQRTHRSKRQVSVGVISDG